MLQAMDVDWDALDEDIEREEKEAEEVKKRLFAALQLEREEAEAETTSLPHSRSQSSPTSDLIYQTPVAARLASKVKLPSAKDLKHRVFSLLVIRDFVYVGSVGCIFVYNAKSLKLVDTLSVRPANCRIYSLIDIPTLNEIWISTDQGSVWCWTREVGRNCKDFLLRAYFRFTNVQETYRWKQINL